MGAISVLDPQLRTSSRWCLPLPNLTRLRCLVSRYLISHCLALLSPLLLFKSIPLLLCIDPPLLNVPHVACWAFHRTKGAGKEGVGVGPLGWPCVRFVNRAWWLVRFWGWNEDVAGGFVNRMGEVEHGVFVL
jgi:hypothetical protein